MVTQNIDLLQERSGSREVVELHGSIRTSSCGGCGGSLAIVNLGPTVLGQRTELRIQAPAGETLQKASYSSPSDDWDRGGVTAVARASFGQR